MQLRQILNNVEGYDYLLENEEACEKFISEINERMTSKVYNEKCLYINSKKAYIDDLVKHHFERIEEYISEDNIYAKNVIRSVYYTKDSEEFNNVDMLKFYELRLLGNLARCFEYEIDKYLYYNSDVEIIKEVLDDVLVELDKSIRDAQINPGNKIISIKEIINRKSILH